MIILKNIMTFIILMIFQIICGMHIHMMDISMVFQVIQWAALLFARDDVLDEAGLEVPKTLDELVDTADKLNTDDMSGITLSLKASDMLAITFQCFMTACGGWWFDDDMKPTFNSPEAMKAVEYIQKLMNDCPDGSMTYGSDETALAVAQGLAAMGLIQTTRSGDMTILRNLQLWARLVLQLSIN